VPLKFANNQSLTGTTALPSAVPTDNLILISTQTASNSATISFTTGLDSTYDMYEFKFIDIAPRTNATKFQFNLSTDGGSNYNVTKTTSAFYAYHTENDAETNLGYTTAEDLAQSTGFQTLSNDIGNDADNATAGVLTIFNPSSTAYVKHFISRVNYNHDSEYSIDFFVGGYGNTTSAVNAIQFKMASGNLDGTIKMYGVKKS
jgi:hypothetical protein